MVSRAVPSAFAVGQRAKSCRLWKASTAEQELQQSSITSLASTLLLLQVWTPLLTWRCHCCHRWWRPQDLLRQPTPLPIQMAALPLLVMSKVGTLSQNVMPSWPCWQACYLQVRRCHWGCTHTNSLLDILSFSLPEEDAATTSGRGEEQAAEYTYDQEYIDQKYETLLLKVIHRSKRTGFEETKDFPIHVNDLVAGRYQVTSGQHSACCCH